MPAFQSQSTARRGSSVIVRQRKMSQPSPYRVQRRLLNLAYLLFAVGGGLVIGAVVNGYFEFVSASKDLSYQAQLGGRVELEPLHQVFAQRLPDALIGAALVTAGVALWALAFRSLRRKAQANLK